MTLRAAFVTEGGRGEEKEVNLTICPVRFRYLMASMAMRVSIFNVHPLSMKQNQDRKEPEPTAALQNHTIRYSFPQPFMLSGPSDIPRAYIIPITFL